MATILGKENRNKRGKIGPVNKGLTAAGAFMGFPFCGVSGLPDKV
jgi:hypothetical protein